MSPRDEHDELKDAPTLRSLSKADPFQVPEGFFDRFPHQVQARAIAAERRSSGPLAWIMGRSPVTRLAGIAAMVGLILASAFFAFERNEAAPQPMIAEITLTPNEIELDELDDSDLFALLDDAPGLLTAAGAGLDQDEMAAYIEHEEIPLDLLIEEL